jgi:hypothetical protein
MIIDIGVYGRVGDGRGRQYNTMLDMFVTEHRAAKLLYSFHDLPNETIFWAMFGGSKSQVKYTELRTKYKATALPSIYEKVCSNGVSRRHGSPSTSIRSALSYALSWLLL